LFWKRADVKNWAETKAAAADASNKNEITIPVNLE
jgi:hypothetical protein